MSEELVFFLKVDIFRHIINKGFRKRFLLDIVGKTRYRLEEISVPLIISHDMVSDIKKEVFLEVPVRIS